jgi:TonB family protein
MTKATKKSLKTADPVTEALLPENDKRLAGISSFAFALAFSAAIFVSSIDYITDPIFVENTSPDDLTTTMVLEKEKKPDKKKTPPKKKEEIRKRQGGGGKQAGRGNPRTPEKRGILRLIEARSAKQGLAGTIMNNTKFARDVSRVLKNVNGVQRSGQVQFGERRGLANAGFNEGIATGPGNGIDGMLSGLIGGSGGAFDTQRKGNLQAPKPSEIDMGPGGGSRSASEIMKVVNSRTPGLRSAYNKALRKTPGFSGKVTLRFTISPSGKIIKMNKVSSTTGNAQFDSAIMKKVKRWKFKKIKSGNTTVTIPFTFSE